MWVQVAGGDISQQVTLFDYGLSRSGSVPERLLADLRKWLEKSLPQVPPKSTLGKVLYYLHNRWDKLIRYCDASYLRMDNNLAESAIRPFVIGRKNWLFSAAPAQTFTA